MGGKATCTGIAHRIRSPAVKIHLGFLQREQNDLLPMKFVILVLGSVVGSHLSQVMIKTVVGQHLLSQLLEKKGLTVTSLR